MPRLTNIAAAFATGALMSFTHAAHATDTQPTVVLVHGAFADSGSWNGVITKLQSEGYPVIGAANPLRGIKKDARYISSILDGIKGPIVLVGHSYGGNVISNAANGHDNVKALVYVSAFAPDAGETVAQLAGKFPGSTLGSALARPVSLANGGKDLYIDQTKFHAQFAADVPEDKAKRMAAGQRPITAAALEEPAGQPAWKEIPSWFVYGDADKNIPPQTIKWMAKRARAKEVVEIEGGSHVVMVSHPDVVASVIEDAVSK